jgi:hypothetical protein
LLNKIQLGYRQGAQRERIQIVQAMLRLIEFTANVSGSQAATSCVISVSRGWKSNTAPGLCSSLGLTGKSVT